MITTIAPGMILFIVTFIAGILILALACLLDSKTLAKTGLWVQATAGALLLLGIISDLI